MFFDILYILLLWIKCCLKNNRDNYNDSLIMDLDDVSIVCENEDINVDKDVKVKLVLFIIVFIYFC